MSMLKEKEHFVRSLLGFLDVVVGWIALNYSMNFFGFSERFYGSNDYLILNICILAVWFYLSKLLRLSEIYRSRPYSVILFNCLGLSFLGSGIIGLAIFAFRLDYIGMMPLIFFALINSFLMFISKGIIFSLLKYFRRNGKNYRYIVIIGDNSAAPFIRQIIKNKEWGYRIVAIVDGGSLRQEFNSLFPVISSSDVNLDELITGKSVDEVIYCTERPDMKVLEELTFSCSEVGVIFRMYSPFFNMLTNRMHLHYFNTTPMLTFSNVPEDYVSLQVKRLIDFLGSFSVIVLLSPVFVFIAILIKMSSKGPVFFKQKRVGVRGRKFWVYKFRTMVTNAEALRAKLERHNEMDGPVFKMTNDPRITPIGRFLRKTSLDELPQFFNVFLGDMSIVGPRPPIPSEVSKYERWQLRRLSMKPGITCVWQISPSRNDISFEEWMRMDLEYIDNWSLKHDFVIILKTIRTMLRADGK